jgi:hypothetical protein
MGYAQQLFQFTLKKLMLGTLVGKPAAVPQVFNLRAVFFKRGHAGPGYIDR